MESLIIATISFGATIYCLYHLQNISKNSDKILKKLKELTGEVKEIFTKTCIKCDVEFETENESQQYCKECNK